MCGIVGFTGHRQAAPILLEGLAKLEYRGYDSAGVAILTDGGTIETAKKAGKLQALVDLLQAQSARLASMEVELDTARRALHERKVIERAKGALMSRLGLSEEAAFRALQKSSMDHNRRLLDVAEATLSLPDVFFAARGDAHQK